jgi:WD40 repeat protein
MKRSVLLLIAISILIPGHGMLAQAVAPLWLKSGHTGPVNALEYSADGQYLASAGSDGTIKFWHPSTRAFIKSFVVDRPVYSISFSPDSRYLVSCDREEVGYQTYSGKCQLWDIETGSVIRSLGRATRARYSPDGKTIAIQSMQSDGFPSLNLQLIDAATGTVKRTFVSRGYAFNGFEFSPDGDYIVIASLLDSIRVWDVEHGSQKGGFYLPTYYHQQIAFSADGTMMAAGGDDSIRVWNFQSGDTVKTIYTWWATPTLRFSPDGTKLVCAANQFVELYDLSSGEELFEYDNRHEGEVSSAVFSPDGNDIISSGYEGQIDIWDVSSGALVDSIASLHGEAVLTARFSPDNTTLATAGYNGTIRLWNASTGRLLTTLSGHTASVHAISYSRDGRYLTSAGSWELKQWDASTGDLVHTVETSSRMAAFSSNGRYAAVTHGPPSCSAFIMWVYVVDISNGATLFIDTLKSQVTSIAFTPDERSIAITTTKGTELWDIATHQRIWSEPAVAGSSNLVFSPDGRYFIDYLHIYRGTAGIRLWESELHILVKEFAADSASDINFLSFASNGASVVAMFSDGAITRWNTSSGGVESDWQYSYPVPLSCGAVSDEMAHIATGMEDGTVAVWKLDAVVNSIDPERTAADLSYPRLRCYPIPSRSLVNIEFELVQPGIVDLKLVDQTGREVVRLVDDVLSAGVHRVTWNAESLPAGVYQLQMRTPSAMTTEPILIVR